MAGKSADGSESRSADSATTSGTDLPWRSYFGFDDPYDNQVDAIETAIDTALDGGYLTMEGPCGTGKTMAALTVAATLIRESDKYENAIVVTPVKQQLRQFVEDLQSLNRTLDEPLSGLALVGKADLCPYGREDVFPADVGVHDRCEDLREETAALVNAERSPLSPDSTTANPTATASGTPPRSRSDPEDRWWDPALASTLAKSAHHDASEFRQVVDEPLVTGGARSPYQKSEPTVPNSLIDGDATHSFCPFEADWYAREKGSPVAFADGQDGVLTSEDFLPKAVEYGTCPHRVMGVLLEHAEIVIGNYNHLFDPKSRPLTDPILDDSTFVIVDEAHRIEERVRDLLSDSIGRSSIVRARGDIDFLLRYARQAEPNRAYVEAELARFELPVRLLERTRDFYDDVEDWLLERVDTYVSEEFHDESPQQSDREEPNGGSAGETTPLDSGDTITDSNSDTLADSAAPSSSDSEPIRQNSPLPYPEHDLEIPLRDPERAEPDALRTWAIDQGYEADCWQSLRTVGDAVESILDEVDGDRTCVCAAVGSLFEHWWRRDHTTYFRELSLRYSPKDHHRLDRQWEGYYTPSLVMYNCLPATELRRMFGQLGGGLVMSATLEPIDVFREVTGLADVDRPSDRRGDPSTEADGEARDIDADANVTETDTDAPSSAVDSTGADGLGTAARPVVQRTYNLQYPPENRASWIVDAPPFTSRNRGDPSVENRNATREKYAYALRTIATSPGNVLLCLPNYREARWAADRLRPVVDKPVLLDESSSNEATTELKRSFVEGEWKVLVTSTRGTLTEGVDFDGDKLHTCAVVGVPLVNVGSPRVRAVVHAYGEQFGENNAFEYALTVPAVRRTRQAIGRVIRGPDERGVRILLGNRYTEEAYHNSVFEYLPEAARDEFVRMTPEFLDSQFESFWGDEPP